MICSLASVPRNVIEAQVSVLRGLRSRLDGSFEIDPWGFDSVAHSALMSLAAARWDLDVDGLANVPESGPVILVVQQRFGSSEQMVLSLALDAVGRHVRRVGIRGSELLEPSFRLVGGVIDDPAEIRGLLRDGHAVSIPMRRSMLGDRRGTLDPSVMEPALEMKVPVLPVLVDGSDWRRRRRVVIGSRIEAPVEDGRLGAIEMAGLTRDAVVHMADTGAR